MMLPCCEFFSFNVTVNCRDLHCSENNREQCCNVMNPAEIDIVFCVCTTYCESCSTVWVFFSLGVKSKTSEIIISSTTLETWCAFCKQQDTNRKEEELGERKIPDSFLIITQLCGTAVTFQIALLKTYYMEGLRKKACYCSSPPSQIYLITAVKCKHAFFPSSVSPYH